MTSSQPDRRIERGRARHASGGPIPPFQVFLEEHRTVVYRFLLAQVGPNEADDCFQEAFLSALRAYPTLQDASNLRGWILTIATRKALDAARRRQRRPVSVGDVTEVADALGTADWSTEREAFDRVASRNGLWRAVRELPPRQRAAAVHRFVLDRPYAEIAEAMGSTEEAARANVHEAVKKLRARQDSWSEMDDEFERSTR
jgi:RNA polymerase sigma factor (sigma-70 family)